MSRTFLRVVFCIFLFTTSVGYSQSDSLEVMHYSDKQLDSLYALNRFSNPSKAMRYAKELLQRASHFNDSKKKADALYKNAYAESYANNSEAAHNYIDSAILIAKNELNDNVLLHQYISQKGEFFYNAGAYNNALKYYKKALDFHTKQQDTTAILTIFHNIALIKNIIGESKDATKILLKNYKHSRILERTSSTNFNEVFYISTLIALADAYVRSAIDEKEVKTRLLDSASMYVNIGFEKSKYYNDYDGFNYFLIENAIINYEKGFYHDAIDTLWVAKKNADKLNQKNTLSSIYFYLGKSYNQLKDTDNAIAYLKKTDATAPKNSFNYPVLQETYYLLSNIYKTKKDSLNLIKYQNLYVENDRINDEIANTVRNEIHSKFDIASLKSEIKNLEQINEVQVKNYYKAIVIIILLSVFLLVLLLFYKRKQKQNRIAFDKLMLTIEKEKNNTSKKPIKQLKIDDDNVTRILKELTKFEEKKLFLGTQCDLTFVAKKVKTNKAYLSKVIHTQKQQSFIQYITKLRIDYVLERLKEDSSFRSYDIKSIALELGYKSSDSFSKAFKARTGINPSFYIKNLNKLDEKADKMKS